jgi:hypothetical protein
VSREMEFILVDRIGQVLEAVMASRPVDARAARAAAAAAVRGGRGRNGKLPRASLRTARRAPGRR